MLFGRTRGGFRYKAWLKKLQKTCRAAGVVLIFDEVYTGFRLAAGGAQEVKVGRTHRRRRLSSKRPTALSTQNWN